MGRLDLLYNAATRLFSEKGYRGASLQELAEEVGIQKASLYHYIPSKEELLYQIFLSVGERIKSQFLRIRREFPHPLERVERFICCYLSFVVIDKQAFQIFLTEKKELSPEHKEKVNSICDLLNSLMKEAIVQAKNEGMISPNIKEDLATLFIFGACNWVVGWFSPRGASSIEEVAQNYAEIFLNGLKNPQRIQPWTPFSTPPV
jgi:AcrR family transcriptional regulator